MAETKKLSESLENYLETILELQSTKVVARSKDIAEKLDIKPGSVSGSLKKLAEKKLIKYEPYGYVTLTPEGEQIALKIEQRHIFLKDFFFRVLKVDEELADKTACQIEHALDHETFIKFKDFVEKTEVLINAKV